MVQNKQDKSNSNMYSQIESDFVCEKIEGNILLDFDIF